MGLTPTCSRGAGVGYGHGMTEIVQFSLAGDVAVVDIDDGKANALSFDLLAGLDAAVTRAAEEAKALAVIGREGKFSAGFDLKVMTSDPHEAGRMLNTGGELALRLFELPIPVVFGVTGHALAMGGILLTVADYRVGAEGPYKIGLNEVAIGMPVPRFAVELCRDRLSPAWFTRCVQHAELPGPADAVAAGFLDEVTSLESVRSRAVEVAQRLAETCNPGAFAMTRVNTRGELARRLVGINTEDRSMADGFRVQGG